MAVEKLNWGILGAGGIAKAFAQGVKTSRTGRLQAVASRSQGKADKFGGEFAIPTRHGSYEALLADEGVQAVYIATPHPMHAEWAIKAAEAGKHVLVEKPIGINHAQAMAMVEAAARNNVFLMEAFMYRAHPQIARLVELLRGKAIGEVRVIQASFSFHAGFNAEGRLFKNDLAGGGILDVGCYATSMARLIAGVATGGTIAEPIEVKGCAHLGQTGVDEWAIGSLKFPGGVMAQVTTGVGVNQENVVRIFGSEGSILLPAPWGMGREAHTTKIIVNRKGASAPETTEVATDRGSYALEADVVGDAVAAGRTQAEFPAMGWDDTVGNMRTLDRWRESVGLVYEQERPQNVPTIHRRPLRRAEPTTMKYGQIAGVNKPVSRLVMGVDNNTFSPNVAVMWDDFVERGGNCWDCAFIYGGGRSEKALGDWVRARGIRDKVVILDKGAHTPFCDPAGITREHRISLERLGMDHVDIYMMHRDNPAIPVGEFVDVLNEHIGRGTMRAVGGSNWSISRVEEFNAWAKKNGKQGFSAVSNNFSLARMVDPVWGGCIAASDAESRAWFKRTQMPLMPWSSQARGFFLDGRAHPDRKDDAELVRCWYGPDNFQRLERARELASKYKVLPIAIALAYVLRQPFPTFPLIGPRQLSETRTSFPALGVELTDAEIRWLNLEE
jgi:predicted dehydrogenase/aryl-alcohol dehydrogenase-like predicted oxidoreductase